MPGWRPPSTTASRCTSSRCSPTSAGPGLAAGDGGRGARRSGAADVPDPGRGAAGRGRERGARRRHRGGVVRVWIDLTNSPHVADLRDRRLSAAMHARGWDVSRSPRVIGVAQTLSPARDCTGIEHTVVGRPRGRVDGPGKARAAADRVGGHDPPRTPGGGFDVAGRARLDRPADGLPGSSRPQRDHVRLRVRSAPAWPQLPARPARADAGCDPGRSRGRLRRQAAQAGHIPGAEGGVLPGRLRARPGRAASAGTGRLPHRAGAAAAGRPGALSPVREPAVRRAARAARASR